MREIAWQNDDKGMLLGARAHDAKLISLDFVNLHKLLLTLRRVDATQVKLSYEGVQEVSLGQIWDNSIVSAIFIWSVENVPSSKLVDVGWNALFQGRTAPQDLKDDIEKIINRDRSQYLSVVSFAHGASMAVICKTLVVTEV
ncbi:hypothetical protein FBZ98_11546 [Rhizobium sp. ERR 922]|uniref:hypothetical protein n=1 Tax=unclassified Rhizobium TaxID=2613769 RepID=UPI0011A03307|nr:MULTISPECIES: hypothetical protein [unclassified Rhizobium]TWB45576.1 hypothetical protein FBZ98_11546 [Rhizobium sp. ERR 922]TWB88188.1 hypothetical protein FBZ97_11411 [Rhizobium sp. ERR 942]